MARAAPKSRPAAGRTRRSPASVAQIVAALRARIAAQDIPPGAKLRESDLAEEFGVPRTRVRDALAALGVAEARLQPDANLDAGLVVEAGGARLDGTPAALLAVRSEVEAELLAEIARASGGDLAHE